MERRAGVFVSLHKGDALRGCIGHIEPDQPLSRAVPSSAIAAASTDPRFAPVTTEEMTELQIELSILGPLERIASVGDVEVGRHGLLVERGWNRGLLLPQVAVEWGWDAEAFLSQTCHKAGLPLDAWKSAATHLAVRGRSLQRGLIRPRSVFRFLTSSGSATIGPVARLSDFGVSSSIGRP